MVPVLSKEHEFLSDSGGDAWSTRIGALLCVDGCGVGGASARERITKGDER
jgi:hypothetical protein